MAGGSSDPSSQETGAQRRELPETEQKAEKAGAAAKKKRARAETHGRKTGTTRANEESVWDRLRRDSAAKRGADKKAEKPQPSPEELKKKAERAKHAKLAAVIFVAFFALLISALAIGGYIVTFGATNFPNVYIAGIDVGGMTKEQTRAVLEQNNWDRKVDSVLTVKLPAKVSFKVDYTGSGAKLTADRAVEAAYGYGRDHNWFTNLFRYLLNCLVPVDIDQDVKTLNSEYIRSRINGGLEQLAAATADKGYKIDRDKKLLTMVKGAGKIRLDETGLYNAVTAALLAGQEETSYSALAEELTEPDFQKLYSELAVEPADAYFTETFDVVDEVIGCRFNVDTAKKVWEAAGLAEEVKIPLEITYPEVTAEKLRASLYADKLGSQTTYYTWSTANRINNINLAADKINGLIMMPGDVFSFNESIGQRTEEAGFKSAGAYNDGQVVEAIGGGICQVSSTLYCATMFANLKTVSRTNHYFRVDYLDYGLDATVSWTKPDYKFSNNRDYPIKLVAYCDNDEKSLTIEIWGTDVDGSYVTLRHTSEPVYDETYTDTVIGYTVYGYRTVYDADGNYLYELSEPGGVYYLHAESIDWPEEKLSEDEYIGALEQLIRAG